MKLSIFGHDIAAEENLKMVADEAQREGHEVKAVYGNNNLTPDNQRLLFESPPDAYLTGMASTEPQGDLFVGETAKRQGKPWTVLADTWLGGFRRAAKGKVDNAVLLTAARDENAPAMTFGYRDARFLGGPPKWQTIPDEPQYDIRKKIDMREDQRLFLLVGGKNELVVTEMLEDFEQAIKLLLYDDFAMIFKPHPKEGEDRNALRRAKVLAPSRLGLNLIETPARASALMSCSDCVIATPGSGATIEAIFHRRPNIWWENPKALARFQQMTDADSWPPLEAGATLRVVNSPAEGQTDLSMLIAIARMLVAPYKEKMLRKQEEAFPIVGPQEIEKRIVRFLEELTQKSKTT